MRSLREQGQAGGRGVTVHGAGQSGRDDAWRWKLAWEESEERLGSRRGGRIEADAAVTLIENMLFAGGEDNGPRMGRIKENVS